MTAPTLTPRVPRHYRERAIVVIPFIMGMAREDTIRAVADQSDGDYNMIELDPGDPQAYGKALCDLWGTGYDLIVVEQDIVIPPGSLDALIDCPYRWCGHAYHTGTRTPSFGLGYCRFSAGLQRDYQNLAWFAARKVQGGPFTQDWVGLNERYIGELAKRQVYLHDHEPEARHLHRYGDDG